MNASRQRLVDYLAHVLEAIERIATYTANMQEVDFLENRLVQDAVVRNLEIIGEASNNIQKRYPDFVLMHPDLPFSAAYEMRNALSHGYFKIDFDMVWKTIHGKLPDLHAQVTVARSVLTGLAL